MFLNRRIETRERDVEDLKRVVEFLQNNIIIIVLMVQIKKFLAKYIFTQPKTVFRMIKFFVHIAVIIRYNRDRYNRFFVLRFMTIFDRNEIRF